MQDYAFTQVVQLATCGTHKFSDSRHLPTRPGRPCARRTAQPPRLVAQSGEHGLHDEGIVEAVLMDEVSGVQICVVFSCREVKPYGLTVGLTRSLRFSMLCLR